MDHFTEHHEFEMKNEPEQQTRSTNLEDIKRSVNPDSHEAKNRYNAVKHGLWSKTLTPFDDPEEYDEILRELDFLYPIRNPIAKTWKHQIALDHPPAAQCSYRGRGHYFNMHSARPLKRINVR
jgi:hypothetical protein